MITLAPKRAMTGSSRGRPWARHHSSTIPTSTNPAEAWKGPFQGTSGTWPA
jgi:hypothetical protein